MLLLLAKFSNVQNVQTFLNLSVYEIINQNSQQPTNLLHISLQRPKSMTLKIVEGIFESETNLWKKANGSGRERAKMCQLLAGLFVIRS